MNKSRFYQMDFAIQTALLTFFLICLILGKIELLNFLLFCQLALGAWQLLSSAVWGLLMAEYNRGRFFFTAVLALGAMSVLLGLPEFRDSELLLLLGNFGALCLIAAYYWQSFIDLKIGFGENQFA